MYNDTLVSQMMDGSTLQYLGQFIPTPGNELDKLDFLSCGKKLKTGKVIL